MQEIKHILFVPHSPEQPINAVILAKKLSKAATALGISNDVAMQVVAVGFIIGVIQDAAETALNSSTDVIFTAAACEAAENKAKLG